MRLREGKVVGKLGALSDAARMSDKCLKCVGDL